MFRHLNSLKHTNLNNMISFQLDMNQQIPVSYPSIIPTKIFTFPPKGPNHD